MSYIKLAMGLMRRPGFTFASKVTKSPTETIPKPS